MQKCIFIGCFFLAFSASGKYGLDPGKSYQFTFKDGTTIKGAKLLSESATTYIIWVDELNPGVVIQKDSLVRVPVIAAKINAKPDVRSDAHESNTSGNANNPEAGKRSSENYRYGIDLQFAFDPFQKTPILTQGEARGAFPLIGVQAAAKLPVRIKWLHNRALLAAVAFYDYRQIYGDGGGNVLAYFSTYSGSAGFEWGYEIFPVISFIFNVKMGVAYGNWNTENKNNGVPVAEAGWGPSVDGLLGLEFNIGPRWMLVTGLKLQQQLLVTRWLVPLQQLFIGASFRL